MGSDETVHININHQAFIDTRSRWSAALIISLCAAFGSVACGSADGATKNGNPSGAPAVSAFDGKFQATWSATATIDTPAGVPDQAYSDTGIITVAGDAKDVMMSWQVGTNAPSGSILFAVSGDSATATGIGVGGECWSGHLTNGNDQTTCATAASAKVSGDTLTQEQSGTISGTTPDHVAYTGTYQGTWVGTRMHD